MNESLKTFVCKSENISCTFFVLNWCRYDSSTILLILFWNSKMKYSTTNKTTKITNQVEKNIKFSWIIETIGEKDLFIIHFDEFEFKDDTCEITYDNKTNSINIYAPDYNNGTESFTATISNIGKEN